MKQEKLLDAEYQVSEPVLPKEVRAAIDTGTLPQTVKPLLLGLMGVLAYTDLLWRRHEQRWNELVEQNLDHVRNHRSLLNRVKRDVRTARQFLSALEKPLERLKAAMDLDPNTVALAEIRLKLDELEQKLGLGPRPAVRRPGAPGVPEHFYRYGAQVVLLLEEHGISRSKAAEATSACIRPFLPAREEGKTPYKFTGKLLTKWMRDKGPELIVYINRFFGAGPA